MIVKVTLDIALGKDFDYTVPPEWAPMIEVGSRVKVPFGNRTLLGTATEVIDAPPRPGLKPILKVLGSRSLITPQVLALARWMAEYYCCPVETALKTALPVSVRREKADFRRRLTVAPAGGAELPPLTPRQKEIFHLIEERGRIPLRELLRLTGCTADTVRRLEAKGAVRITREAEERDPYAAERFVPTKPLELNAEQQAALESIMTGVAAARPGPLNETGPVFLLYGVTGSGKTEVYLQAIARALEQGKGAIVLVPEISLTPQTIERFKARFSSGPIQTEVAVLHSHLSHGERHDQWHRIRSGRARIVIGARSAVFAPVESLGLIIVDEEHERSYKQEEAPRYHARDVAVVRGRLEGAAVALGSATPSLESFYNARRGKYTLLELPRRIDDRKLPHVRVVDMRRERGEGRPNRIFSQLLLRAIEKRLEQREQAILFLNRRGFAPIVQCPLCGYVARCSECSVALTYHRAKEKLCCHLCGRVEEPPQVCPNPQCRNPAIRYAGAGTQRVEETLRRLFPKARVQRMDSDILQRKEDYRRILGDFRTGKIDILVGTQMIAKGLHFPRVTLVGIVNADMSLHRPDFRAAERTFQLLTQVSGRAGRGDVEGEVYIQAFTPFHPAIQYARRHDYLSFYEEEVEFRRQLRYPPFTRIALLTLRGLNEDKVRFAIEHLRRRLAEKLKDLEDLEIAGPAPAPILRIRGFYRHQLVLKAVRMTRLSRRLAQALKAFPMPEGLELTVDVDPADLGG